MIEPEIIVKYFVGDARGVDTTLTKIFANRDDALNYAKTLERVRLAVKVVKIITMVPMNIDITESAKPVQDDGVIDRLKKSVGTLNRYVDDDDDWSGPALSIGGIDPTHMREAREAILAAIAEIKRLRASKGKSLVEQYAAGEIDGATFCSKVDEKLRAEVRAKRKWVPPS